MGIKRYHDRLLAQISNGMTDAACLLHRDELEQLGRRATAACQFREMVEDLKDRVAQRAALRNGSRLAIKRMQRPSQAA
jgi:hypothetical protein